MGSQFNIRDMPEWSDQQLSDMVEWTGYTAATKQERESRMQQDQYEVRVERVGREFTAWQGNDEHLSKEQFELWKSQKNVEKVGRFVNGNWAEAPYIPSR
ncbi:MAG: hypothetical protein AUF65_01365 [Chloroflexi bacterium 13_1_20CM_50_12]|nr:MAG: hypothetical protein AUF65_01365 [Chloroflexi bacterium 13_1_20CM_50_12]